MKSLVEQGKPLSVSAENKVSNAVGVRERQEMGKASQ